MDPLVVAAWIAAGASALTLIGTLAAQYFGRRATSQDTERAFEEQGKQLDRTLAEQREQLNRTLAEQREQLDRTLAEQRTRTLNERFATAAEQMGSDKPAAVRLAGVYAMAGLADDWGDNRQTCVDVLCAYLRMPYEADPGDEASEPEWLAFRASREVRHTVIRVITAHLKVGAAVPWQGLNFDFTGVVFDGGSFNRAKFSSGKVDFRLAEFSDGFVDFGGTEFSGAEVRFRGAKFSGKVDFRLAEFSDGLVGFDESTFSSGWVNFGGCRFPGGAVSFGCCQFSGGEVFFRGAEFSGGEVHFFQDQFSGTKISFSNAEFSGGRVIFAGSKFSGGEVSFDGGGVFGGAKFSGGTVDFSVPGDWSCPPIFPWTGTPPPGVKLPHV
jgi:uncharacterized protein YjbI with pentapeptide repeats